MVRKSSGVEGVVILIILVIGAIIIQYEADNAVAFYTAGIICIVILATILIYNTVINKQRNDLLKEILSLLNLENIDSILKDYDDYVVVKSRQTLDNYTDLKYLKEKEAFDSIVSISNYRMQVKATISSFLENNDYKQRPQYYYVKNLLNNYVQKANGYKILVRYITSAGNNRGEKIVCINNQRVNELISHPELLMSKGEYNKLLKQQSKEELENKKHVLYDRVNSIIDNANEAKDTLIIKSQIDILDELLQKLFDKTVNNIQKVSKIDSDEWGMLDSFISNIDNQITEIIQNDKRISDYYESDDFSQIKETCNLLTQSQKEFNEYINEKAQSISKLFGTRTVRNETQNEDEYNYIRVYKKNITPFTAEVSSTVFGSAENNPIGYIVKYFYPNKSQYIEQIQKLRLLIEELETLREAKEIIENYKMDYEQYIQNVPDYVMKDDESGFYARLGLTIIDESVLNVDYKFTYTSNGGMAQRSFTVPMNEENITALINQLESKLSLAAQAKEQRALMTTRLRIRIKERDNYTCCLCGNSTHVEPNLLLEIDHIIPVAKGGLTEEDNLQTLCWKCNRNKGAKII